MKQFIRRLTRSLFWFIVGLTVTMLVGGALAYFDAQANAPRDDQSASLTAPAESGAREYREKPPRLPVSPEQGSSNSR